MTKRSGITNMQIQGCNLQQYIQSMAHLAHTKCTNSHNTKLQHLHTPSDLMQRSLQVIKTLSNFLQGSTSIELTILSNFSLQIH